MFNILKGHRFIKLEILVVFLYRSRFLLLPSRSLIPTFGMRTVFCQCVAGIEFKLLRSELCRVGNYPNSIVLLMCKYITNILSYVSLSLFCKNNRFDFNIAVITKLFVRSYSVGRSIR